MSRIPYPVLVLERAKIQDRQRQRHLIRQRITHKAILEAWDYRWGLEEAIDAERLAELDAQLADYGTLGP